MRTFLISAVLLCISGIVVGTLLYTVIVKGHSLVCITENTSACASNNNFAELSTQELSRNYAKSILEKLITANYEYGIHQATLYLGTSVVSPKLVPPGYSRYSKADIDRLLNPAVEQEIVQTLTSPNSKD